MRFLHTSDLHLGHRLCDRDRLDEHALFLDWLLAAAGEQSADYLILAGDIFDTSVPSNAALRLYYRFLAAFPRFGIKGALVIGGNHDSPSALNAPRDLLEVLNVHVRGVVSPDPADDVVVIEGLRGERVACALVPYLRERDIRAPKGGESIPERDQGIRDGIRRRLSATQEALSARGADAALVIAHLFTAGSRESGGERDLYVGNLGHIPLSDLPAGADYTALGHIHRCSWPGTGVRYAGSPLAMDFGDTSPKSVTIVDLPCPHTDSGPGGEKLSITEVPVPAFRKLIRYAGTPEEIREAIGSEDASAAGPLGIWAEAQVQLRVPDPQVTAALEDEFCRKGIELLRVQVVLQDQEKPVSGGPGKPLEDISPHEMFALKCRQRSMEPDEALLLAFDELLDEVQREGGEENPGED